MPPFQGTLVHLFFRVHIITDKLAHLLHHFGNETLTLCLTRDSGEQPLQHGDAIALATVDAVWKPGEQKWLGGGGGRCVSKSNELVKMAENMFRS